MRECGVVLRGEPGRGGSGAGQPAASARRRVGAEPGAPANAPGASNATAGRSRGLWLLMVLAFAASPDRGHAQTLVQERGSSNPSVVPVNPETAPRPTARAIRTEGQILIDGRLDEPAWEHAVPFSDFIQSQPRTGYPATERTVVRVLYDDFSLYFGVVAHDSRPDHLTVTSLERDFAALDNDAISIAIDPYLDRRNGYVITVNPAGAVSDMQVFDDHRSTNYAWDGIVHVRTEQSDSGWTMEMAIPWSTVRFDGRRGEQEWGFNILRRVRRINEVSYWSPLDPRELIPKLSRAGTLTGLNDLRTPRSMTVKPYVLAARSSGPLATGSAPGNHFDGGVDAKYAITPTLTLDATYRTDFSHVEADQEQVNLSRFPLFFPERREFFIENSGTFLFGDAGERGFRTGAALSDFTLFHTRRVGLTAQGTPIPMLGGVRLTGRTGGYEVGLLSMQTEPASDLPGENFAVARVRRAVFGNSDIGVLVANRQFTGSGSGSGHNRSFGVDANFRFLGTVAINTYLAGVNAPDLPDDRRAARLSAGFRDRMWDASVMYRRFGEGFSPGAGFVARNGIEHLYATLGIHPRPERLQIREVNPYLEVEQVNNLESILETRNLVAGLDIDFRNGGRANVRIADRYERIDQPFRAAGGVEIGAGAYDFRDAVFAYASNRGRALSGDLSVRHGGYFSGDITSVGAGGVWRASQHLTLDLGASRNLISVPGARATADVLRSALGYAVSTSLFGHLLVQYNGSTDQLVTNARLNFVHAPLSDLFIVFSERRTVESNGPIERSVTLKVTRLIAL